MRHFLRNMGADEDDDFEEEDLEDMVKDIWGAETDKTKGINK